MRNDSCHETVDGLVCFRPMNHPLLERRRCPNCGRHSISLPAYPGDYFDCEGCTYSWKPTDAERDTMIRHKAE